MYGGAHHATGRTSFDGDEEGVGGHKNPQDHLCDE